MANRKSNPFPAGSHISKLPVVKRILLTGATGFIGRHCLPLLAAKGYEIHAVCRKRPESSSLSGVSWHVVNLLEPGCAAGIFRQVQPDCFLHLAWYAAPGKFWVSPENTEWVRASLEMLSAFAENGGERVVVAGSCAEYDWTSGECIEGVTPLQPNSLYGACKHALESILHSWSLQTGVSSAWGRIFFLYGPHEHPSRLVAYVVRSLLQGESALCSEGTQTRDFLYVEDVASAFVALLESEVQGPVNVGSGRPVAVREVLEKIGRQLGRLELIRLGARRSNSEAPCLWANTRRLRAEVRWSPHYDLTRGIERTIHWWRNSMGIVEGDEIQQENAVKQ
jgi:nucleoside-diphosphate-sugar epimerase